MTNAPLIFAIDTTSEFASLALRRAGQTIAQVELHSSDGFDTVIFQAIQNVLRQAQTQLAEVDCFAAANGPGSFTGVRVALSCVKGLAEATHKPAAAISNLRALSLSGSAPLRAVALDARRNHVYGAVYNALGALVIDEIVAPWQEWVKLIPPDAEFIGVANGPCQAAGVPFTIASQYLAVAVAACAEQDGAENWSDPVSLDANYVRRSDAEFSWKDR